jgi:hypothetical protein
MPQMGASARTLFPDRRAILARNRRVSGRPGGRTWPAARAPATTTVRSSPTSRLAQHGLRRLCAPTHSRKSSGADTPDADVERADTDAGHPDTGHPDTGHWTPDADIARADTGRSPRTPDTWTLTEDADRATKARHASGHLATITSRPPAGRRTVFLSEVAHAALGHHDDSTVRRPTSVRDCYRTTRPSRAQDEVTGGPLAWS